MTRKLTVRERKIAALSATLEQEEHAQTPFLPAWTDLCNESEAQFVRRATEKALGCLHRSGWPDFLVEEPGGGIYAVEVKTCTDQIRPNQVATFTALDTNGVRVYVWNPAQPGKLVPWKSYLARSVQGLREERRRLQEVSRNRARGECDQRDCVVNNNETAPKPIRKGAGPRRKYQ